MDGDFQYRSGYWEASKKGSHVVGVTGTATGSPRHGGHATYRICNLVPVMKSLLSSEIQLMIQLLSS